MRGIFIEISEDTARVNISASGADLAICTGIAIREMVRKLTEDYGMEEEIKAVICDYINSDRMEPENLSVEIGSRVVIPSTSGKVTDMAYKMVEKMHDGGSNIFNTFLDFLGEKYGK